MIPVVFPDIEGVLVRALPDLVGVPVSTRVPEPRPEAFVKVTRVGGSKPNLITDSPIVTVECWAADGPSAERLGARTSAYVFALAQTNVDGDWIRRVAGIGGLQSFPDPLSGHSRYQFTVQIDTRGVPL